MAAANDDASVRRVQSVFTGSVPLLWMGRISSDAGEKRLHRLIGRDILRRFIKHRNGRLHTVPGVAAVVGFNEHHSLPPLPPTVLRMDFAPSAAMCGNDRAQGIFPVCGIDGEKG